MPVILKNIKDMGHFEEDQMGMRIVLRENLSKEMMNRTLNHEVFHALLTISGLDEMMDEKIKEALCCMMESWPKEMK